MHTAAYVAVIELREMLDRNGELKSVRKAVEEGISPRPSITAGRYRSMRRSCV